MDQACGGLGSLGYPAGQMVHTVRMELRQKKREGGIDKETKQTLGTMQKCQKVKMERDGVRGAREWAQEMALGA